jgi:hypothetical protein
VKQYDQAGLNAADIVRTAMEALGRDEQVSKDRA